jgi:2,3-dihydroxyphenylpropionate 1,2-dioxygenase
MVTGFATSHTALMIRAQAIADPRQVANVLRGFEEVRKRLTAADVNALIVIGSDHGKTFLLDNMPAFCIGIGSECEGWGDAGVPQYRVKVQQELARFLLNELMQSGFDPAFSAEMKLDHGFMCPLHFITPGMGIPIVPLFVNSTSAPMPSLGRCYELGRALRRAIDLRGNHERIAIIATGGLSHVVPNLDEYLFRAKRELDPDMEKKRLATIKEFAENGLGRINESFDHKLLDFLTAGNYDAFVRNTYEQIEADGGNGAQEIRNWAVLLGALSDTHAEVLVYEPVRNWLTGIGIVAFNATHS